MKINVKKITIIVFRNGGTQIKDKRWFYNDILLETVSIYKYMGLYITPRLIWSFAKTSLASQAKKAIISMIKLQNSVDYFEMNELLKLFDTMAKPILLYASEILGYEYSTTIETLHEQFCRKYLKLPTNVARMFVRGECGRYPLYVDYH